MTTTANGRLFAAQCNGIESAPKLFWFDKGPLTDPADPLRSASAAFRDAAGNAVPCAATTKALAGHQVLGVFASIARSGADDSNASQNTIRVAYPGVEAIGPFQVQVVHVVDVTVGVGASTAIAKNVRTIRAKQFGWSIIGAHFIETNRLRYPGDDAFADAAVLEFTEISPFTTAGPPGTFGASAAAFQTVIGDVWSATQMFPQKKGPALDEWSMLTNDPLKQNLGDYWYGAFDAVPAAKGTWELRYTGLWTQTDRVPSPSGTPFVSIDLHTNTVRLVP